MTLRLSLSFLIAFVIAFWAHATFAHDRMGHFHNSGAIGDYLYGMKRDNPGGPYHLDIINCCRYGGDGDCQLVPVENVKPVNGGWLLPDGEFISQEETTTSPDDKFYRCKHNGATRSHCFFSPAFGG